MTGEPLRPLASSEISVKLFVDDPSGVRLKELIPVFHRWIRESLLEGELLIDVANYEHVPKGPGIVLICDTAHYYFDMRAGRPGLRYRGRRKAEATEEEGIARAFRSVLQAASLLESDPALEGRYRFRTSEVEFGIYDRLRAPSDAETFAAAWPELEKYVKALYGDGDASFDMVSAPEEPFVVAITTPSSSTVDELLGQLAVPSP